MRRPAKFGDVTSGMFTSALDGEKSPTEVYHYLQNSPTAPSAWGYLGIYLSAKSARTNRDDVGDIDGRSQLESYEMRCTYPRPEGVAESAVVTESYKRLGGRGGWAMSICIVDSPGIFTMGRSIARSD